MNQMLQDKLYNKYPLTSGTRVSCLADRGIECQDGWYNILDNLFSKIEPVLLTMNVRDRAETLTLHQIKQKFGELTVYARTEHPIIKEALKEAYETAQKTCELCGQSGCIRKSRWMQVKCDKCVARVFIENLIREIDVNKDIKDEKPYEWSTKTRRMIVKDEKWYDQMVDNMLQHFEPQKGKTISEVILEQQANFAQQQDP